MLFYIVYMILFTLEKNNMIDDIFTKFDGAFAKNTIRAYRSDFIQYQNWCLQNNLEPIPATADTMAMYSDYLSENNKSCHHPQTNQ
jgi:site-specific recombinase XerD